MLDTGDRIDRYEVVDHLGSGSFAEVYLARDTALDRQVAIKVLPQVGPQARREAAAVASMHHPHIVALHDVIDHDGGLCLVYERAPGGSLAERLARDGTLPIEEVARLVREVGSALDHAHGLGILHRDIKPSNILLDANEAFMLVDFGALGLLDHSGHTSAGQIAGTPLYMAPEQIMGARQTPASDLFGLGLVAVEALHGQRPGAGAESYLSLAASRTSTPIEVPSSPLAPLLERLLALDPLERPQSAREAVALLPGGVGAGPLGPPPASSVEVARPAGPPLPPPRPAVEQASPPFETRRPTRLAAVGAALVTLLVLLVVLWSPIGADVILRVTAGAAIAAAAIEGSRRLRARWPDPQVEQRAYDLVFGARDRAELSRSLMIEVDAVVAGLKAVDSRVLGVTIVAMLHEYEKGATSADRQTALLNVVALLERVTTRLSPWHLRHKDSIGLAIAVVGCLAGIASALSGLLGR